MTDEKNSFSTSYSKVLGPDGETLVDATKPMPHDTDPMRPTIKPTIRMQLVQGLPRRIAVLRRHGIDETWAPSAVVLYAYTRITSVLGRRAFDEECLDANTHEDLLDIVAKHLDDL